MSQLDPVAEATRNQRIAADPATSVFVTANAGSGKTKVLVDRIARLLLLPDSRPSAFLCITYTKAAAAEMQRRLFDRLGGWCVADDATLAAELKKLGAEGADLGKARALFAQALETPGGLKIQTIHAFCERLLARFPLEAGVPPGFDIADEARAASLLGEARASAALAPDSPREAFRRFAARMHGEGLEAFLDRLAFRRGEFHRFAEAQGPLFAAQSLRDRHHVSQNADDFAASVISGVDWDDLPQAVALLRESSANNIKAGNRFAEAIKAREASKPALIILEALLDAALKDDGAPYATPVTAAFEKQNPFAAQTVHALTDLAVNARQMLNAINRAEDAIAAMALALKLDQAYADAKARTGVLDFDDLIEHAQMLLQRSDAAPWVLYKLDGGIDHILIDEGQDTSPAQWDLITPLQEEFLAGAGARVRPRTIFAVGDPKQSIYGFQGADPERFLSEAQRLDKGAHAAGVAFTAPELRTSFRTTPEVLRAVDETMRDKPLISGPGEGDEIVHLASRGKEAGIVEVWPWTPRPVVDDPQPWDAPIDMKTGRSAPAQLAKHIAARINAMIAAGESVWEDGKRRAMRAGDVLLLVRTRGAMFRELIKALKIAKLPVAGADRMVLRDELAVEDCLALMRVALDPADDLSLACVLKGSWCNLYNDDTDLFPLAHGRTLGETLFARLMASTDAKYADARAFVAAIVARRGDDAFAFLSWALETPHAGGATGWMRVFERLGPETRDPIEELLQRALKPARHVAPTLQRFISDIDLDAGQVKRELEAEKGAVRVMTVHGAKGLEAPVVILPDATGDVGDAPDNGLIFDDAQGPFVSFRSKDDDAEVAAARATHKARMLREHWRLLYVAMTRARDHLIVCGPQFRNGEAKESWRLAVEEALKRLGAQEFDVSFSPDKALRIGTPVIAKAKAEMQHAFALAPGWVKSAAPGAKLIERAAPSRTERIDPALFSPRGDGQKRFRRGRMIHGLLERLPDVAPERRIAAARAWLERQGADAQEREAFAGEAIKVIEDARFAAVFGPKSRAETPIVGLVEGKAVSGVVDRLVVDDARVIVLDFKTDRPSPTDPALAPESYVLQLALYRAVLRQIFPAKPVICALLWTEAPHLMELAESRLDAAVQHFLRG